MSVINLPNLFYTPGPASGGVEEDLMSAGADGVRLTFSYSTPQYQLERAEFHRKISKKLGSSFIIAADLAGEKVRLGQFRHAPTVPVMAGDEFQLVAGDLSDPSGERMLAVPSRSFFSRLTRGSLVTVGDGSAVFEVLKIGFETTSVVAVGNGTINQRRGLTVQGGGFMPVCLTDKDYADLRFVAETEAFDAVALSFVSSEADVAQARNVLSSYASSLPIIAKVETAVGIDNLTEICNAADIVMAARGDLALAVPWVELPAAMDEIERASRQSGTPWILATQVAEGLERFVMPTRAEICDLAHWLKLGCSGVLLSYETAFGANPTQAVKVTRQMIERWGLRSPRPPAAVD
jgi:pyruvate kinase